MANITESKRDQIRALLRFGITHRRICKLLHVSLLTIQRVRAGRYDDLDPQELERRKFRIRSKWSEKTRMRRRKGSGLTRLR